MDNKEHLIKLLERVPDTLAAYAYIWLKHAIEMPEGIIVDTEFCETLLGEAMKNRFKTISTEELAAEWHVTLDA